MHVIFSSRRFAQPCRGRGGRGHLERAGAVSDEGRADLADAVGEGEFEVRHEQLLDVRPAHVRRLLDLHHTQDL